MPRAQKPTVLERLGEAIADLVQDVLGTILPSPEPKRIPVRVRDRR